MGWVRVGVVWESERAAEDDEALAEEEGPTEAVMEAEKGPGAKAVGASRKATEVAAEATTGGEMPAAKVASAKVAREAAAEVASSADVPAATEVPGTTHVPAAAAHAYGVRYAAGKRERQENREPESRGGGQRSANGLELHASSLVAAGSAVKGCPHTARLPGQGREAGADTSHGPRPAATPGGAAGRRGAVPGDGGGKVRNHSRHG